MAEPIKKAKLCSSNSQSQSIKNFFKTAVESASATHDGSDSRSRQAEEDESIRTSSESDMDDDSYEESDGEYLDDETTSVNMSIAAEKNVRLEPHQPKKKFPIVSCGGQSRSFQSSWFAKWPWLEWDDQAECAFCHPCRMSTHLNFMRFSTKAEKTFSSIGFRNWKDATRLFRKHESSHAHKEAIMKWVHHKKTHSIAAQISRQVRDDQAKAQTCLSKIISSLQFIARQGLPSRGHDDMEGNFLQLLHLRSSDCDLLREWIVQRQNWTSHDIQNEIFEIMAHTVLRQITYNIRAHKYYSLVVDEATDVSFTEQVSICICHVSDDMEIYEDFLGLYDTGNTTAEVLTTIIKDVLCRCGLDLLDCRGQTYHGASNMRGRISGVQARNSSEYPKAVFIHCFCHSLNLAIQDSCKGIPCIRNALNTIQELSNLIKYSGKRKSHLERVRLDLSCSGPSLRPLCVTRWTAKSKSFESVLLNYEAILEMLHEIVAESDGSIEIVAKAGGIQRSMENYELLFGIMLGVDFFGLTDSLSGSMQGKTVTACDAKAASDSVCAKIKRMRTDLEFDAFWEKTTKKSQELQLSEPAVPRVRRPPRRIDSGSNPSTFLSPKDYYRKIYFEYLDNILGEVSRRFDQENFHMYIRVEQLLLQAASAGRILDENLKETCKHFGDDFDHLRLKNQLAILHDLVGLVNPTLQDIQKAILALDTTSCLFSEVLKLIKMLYVIPASTASAERSFSSLRRLKTYLRNSMTSQRLNHMMVLYAHKELTDQLDLRRVASEFISSNERRKHVFGIINT